MHEAAGPLLLVLVMAAVHAAYFVLLKGKTVQQTIRLPPQAPLGPPPGRRPLRTVPSDGGEAAVPVRQRTTLRIEAGLFRRPMICGQDIHVAGEAAFGGAVKIEGDLLVTGFAVFDEPVVVNGRVRVTGNAAFRAGLVVKSELQVEGQMRVGSAAGGGWLSARQVRIDGALWVNGQPEHVAVGRRWEARA